MSYILDALKKSEQERGHGNIPDVQTVHSSSLNYRNEKRAIWPYALIAVVSLNLLAITYFIVNKEEPASTQDVAQVVEISPAPEEKVITTVESEPYIEPTPELSSIPAEKQPVIKQLVASQPVATAPIKESKAVEYTEYKPTIVDFYELPESIKQQIPVINISAHVYSSNSLQRSVVINNNFMEEGEYVLDGLILYEITPDGAIFNYQGTMFNYGVVSGWQ
ncbi:MAG: general secretion pathway protein GspB [Proteobacteria bacterium]|nr:general secretion pathway protein GspB [Pseudomonadota bacterium]